MIFSNEHKTQHAQLKFNAQRTRLFCRGDWTLNGSKHLDRCLTKTIRHCPENCILDASQIQRMDTAGAWLLFQLQKQLQKKQPQCTLTGLKPAHSALLKLVHSKTPGQTSNNVPHQAPGLLENIGRQVWRKSLATIDFISFIGETTNSIFHSMLQPARIRWQAIWVTLAQAGVNALPIVGLMSFLIGIVLAYQGGTQLAQYGANIFIVDLVGITLLRELAPMLTAIMIAGRTGSAFTAQIGTMKINDEVDALRTMGIAPMELLVLPKLLALMIAMPLLCVFADITGVLGGMLIASLTLDVSFFEFLDRFQHAIALRHFIIGIGKAPIFAAIIVLIACYQGFRVQGGADSVGKQVTVSVVQSIFLVIVIDALFSILFNWAGI
ncbi:ABC transporter permease [Candidatus Venteria ishoeyi]|uniref:MlaE family ABC transporter permease n=1 Tax=Candidatus Venteria ishoeyi TaxID=1899563 RepID=UPI0025A63AF7|nr:ABC transporter permease [Candidatus Venteria ishoeyi]MDM8548281.1 ABC transporter permease [Candidatus Venteria ishoeyi]